MAPAALELNDVIALLRRCVASKIHGVLTVELAPDKPLRAALKGGIHNRRDLKTQLPRLPAEVELPPGAAGSAA